MKNILLNIRRGAIAFAATVIVGLILLLIVYLLPTGRVQLHIRESGLQLVNEDLYQEMIPTDVRYRMDNSTDCVMLQTAGYSGPENVFVRFAENFRIDGVGKSKQEACLNCGQIHEPEMTKVSYSRYWHGYLVVLKPMLVVFNLQEIRQLNMFIIFAFITAIMVLLVKRKKPMYTVPFLMAYTFLNPALIANSLQNSTMFYVTSIALVAMLIFCENKKFTSNIAIYFMMVGMLTSYIDFLTYPIVSLAFPLILYFVLFSPKSIWKGIIKLVLYSALWCVGYVGMWASKWGISSLILRRNMFSDAIQKIFERSSDVAWDKPITYKDMLSSLNAFLGPNPLFKLTIFFMIICVVLIVVDAIKSKSFEAKNIFTTLLILAVAIYPYAWAMAIKNHTFIHLLFTHRILSVVILSLGCSLVPMVKLGRKEK